MIIQRTERATARVMGDDREGAVLVTVFGLAFVPDEDRDRDLDTGSAVMIKAGNGRCIAAWIRRSDLQELSEQIHFDWTRNPQKP